MVKIVNQKYSVNKIENINEFTYGFRNALVDMIKLDDWNKKILYMISTQMIVLSNTDKDVDNIYTCLFKDENYEVLVSFYRGVPFTIPREYLEDIMGLAPGQKIEDFLDSIEFNYRKEKYSRIAEKFFLQMASGLEEYEIDNSSHPAVKRVDEKLNMGKKVRLYAGEIASISLTKKNHYIIEKRVNVKKENDLGGLLGDLDWFEPQIESWVIDPISAKTLLTYFYGDTEAMITEGEIFLLDIMDNYPRMGEDKDE